MNNLLELGLANALVAAILTVPAYCLSRWGKRPALAHVFWLFILIKLVTPPFWHVPVALQNFSTNQANLAAPTSNDRVLPATDWQFREAHQSLPMAVRSDEPPVQLSPVVEVAETKQAPTLLDAEATSLWTTGQKTATAFPWREALGICWLAGSLLVFALTAFRLASFFRCLRHVRPAPPDVQELAVELSRRLRLRSTPQLGIAPMRLAPLVWGWGSKARVIIPKELWNTLDGEQRSMLLVHELAHLKRGDHWVRLLEIVVRALYWWHPAVWLAAREMREAEEQCCDAWAVWVLPHAAKSYARALVDTVDFLSQRSVPLPVGASGIGQVQDLRRRLIMIMRGTTPRELSTTTLVVLVLLGGLVFLMSPTFAQQGLTAPSALADEPTEPPQPPRAVTPVRGVSFTDPFADDEVARLRQQEENLRRAMEAVARSLEQTKKQLDSIEGAPARDPRVPQAAAPRRAIEPTAAADAQPRPRVSAPRRADDVRSATPPVPADVLPRMRPGREMPMEERLSRLEERMSQIAEDLQALRHDMRPAALPRRGEPLPRRQARPAAPVGIPAVPSVEGVPSSDQLVPSVSPVPPAPVAPPAEVPVAPARPSKNRTPPSEDLAPPPAVAVPPAGPAARPLRTPPVPIRPSSNSVDEKPETLGVRR